MARDAYRGRTALVTGASSGIGEAFARVLAERGAAVILVARSAQRLDALAAQLRERHGVEATPIVADLASGEGLAAVPAQVAKHGRQVDILINNAGIGTHGAFPELPMDRERDEMQLNCIAPVALAKAFLPAMLERADGAIVNVASTAAFQPTPGMAVYGATKAFVLSFSEALRVETRARGVRVLALCPGPTRTHFFANTGSPKMQRNPFFARGMEPERVARTALAALERDRGVAIPGAFNKFGAFGVRLGPRALVARMSGKVVGATR